MGILYTVTVSGVAASAAQDLFEVLAAADATIVIHSLSIGQITELGDAAEEIMLITTKRGLGATSGSGGSTPTPVAQEAGAPATGATVEANNTTIATAGGGSLTAQENMGWNVRVPFEKVWTPETRPIISGGDLWAVTMDTPDDAMTLMATLVYEEIGG